ncbi:MAG: tRNA pseudouridine(55) synthase TruB [Gammaproteobacteria bacterium]|nr:tRNA pseudouridine(55) synthase TruB [Gammaproteobacteria bacterium]MCF6361871.1 tRNA pseudouridine(55) synthase TruB [Gammaproteobacteria bacterium]
MARRRNRGRNVHGILLLDKPIGLTSNRALQWVKRLFNANKAGHTGSLDPLATGMLPICLGEATKVSGFLLNADKQYRAVCKLGVKTRSGDAEGEVIEERPVGPLTRAQVSEVLEGFLGPQMQTPPMHSAIKQQGVPLYKLAHQGIEVAREAREVTIHRIELLRLDGDELEIDVCCSKGTYIRTLAEDIGEMLGCGAHIAALYRTAVGGLENLRMVDFEALESLAEQGFEALDALLLPAGDALPEWPAVRLSEDASFYLCQGQPVFVPQLKDRGWVRLYRGDKEFLGLGTVLDDGRVAPKRLLVPSS